MPRVGRTELAPSEDQELDRVKREEQGAPADEWFTEEYLQRAEPLSSSRSPEELDDLQHQLTTKPGLFKLYSIHKNANSARTRRAQLLATKRWDPAYQTDGEFEFLVRKSDAANPLVEAEVPVGQAGLFVRWVVRP